MRKNRPPYKRKSHLQDQISQTIQQEEQSQAQISQAVAQDLPKIAKTQILKYEMFELPSNPNKIKVVIPEETAEALTKEKLSLVKIRSRIYFVEKITKDTRDQSMLVCPKAADWERERTGRNTVFHHGEAGDYYAQISCQEEKECFFYKIRVYSRKKHKDVFKQMVREDWESTLPRARFKADDMISFCRASDHKKEQSEKKSA